MYIERQCRYSVLLAERDTFRNDFYRRRLFKISKKKRIPVFIYNSTMAKIPGTRERGQKRNYKVTYLYFEEMEGFEVTACLGDVSTLAIVRKWKKRRSERVRFVSFNTSVYIHTHVHIYIYIVLRVERG